MRVPIRGKGTAEPADLTVKRKKYRRDLLPSGLFVARYFAAEQAGVDGATTHTGKVTQAAVRARLKEVADDREGRDERDALEVCLELMKALAAAKRATKAARTKLDAKEAALR